MQSTSFLESDSLSAKRVLIFGITRIQSRPTFKQIKDIDEHYEQFRSMGFDEVYCLTFSDFPLYDQMMSYMVKQVKYIRDLNIDQFKQHVKKYGNSKFLKDNWQFACVLNNGQVEFYAEHPFDPLDRDMDTQRNIYGEIKPSELLEILNSITGESK